MISNPYLFYIAGVLFLAQYDYRLIVVGLFSACLWFFFLKGVLLEASQIYHDTSQNRNPISFRKAIEQPSARKQLAEDRHNRLKDFNRRQFDDFNMLKTNLDDLVSMLLKLSKTTTIGGNKANRSVTLRRVFSTIIEDFSFSFYKFLCEEQSLCRNFIRRAVFAVLRSLNKRVADGGINWVAHEVVLKGSDEQVKYLRAFVTKCLNSLKNNQKLNAFAPSNELTTSLITDTLVDNGLYHLVNLISTPLWVNTLIAQTAKRKLEERKIADIFYQVLRESAYGFPSAEYRNDKIWADRPVTRMDSRISYCESLLKHAKRCRSIVDAKNVRYSLLVELQRTERNMNANPERRDALEKYLKTVSMAINRYEKRIISLRLEQKNNGLTTQAATSEFDSFHSTTEIEQGSILKSPKAKNPKKVFTTIVDNEFYDSSLPSNATSPNQPEDLKKMLIDHYERRSENLFYFLQFMENSGKEKKVQFWLEIQTLRDIYEDTKQDSSDFLRKEMARLFQTFLNSEQLLEVIHPSTLLALKRFISGEDSSFLCVMEAQNEIYDNMEKFDFPEYLKSESFVRFKGDMERLTLNSPVLEESTNDLTSPKLLAVPYTSRLPHNRPNTPFSKDYDFEKSDLLSSLKRSLKRILKTSSAGDGSELISPISDASGARSPAKMFSLKTFLNASVASGDVENFTRNNKARHSNQSSISLPAKGVVESSEPNVFSEINYDDLAQRLPIQDRLEMVQLQIALVEYLMKSYPKVSALDSPRITSAISILKRTRELLRRQLGDLVENKMSSDIFSGQEIEEFVWSVFITPAGSKAKESVYFLDVTITDPKTNLTKSWLVTRRFDEFQVLHNQLKELFPSVADFSSKLFIPRINWHRSKEELFQERNLSLAKYLKLLVENSEISKTEVLRKFLSDDSPFSHKRPGLRKRQNLSQEKIMFKLNDSISPPQSVALSSSLHMSDLLSASSDDGDMSPMRNFPAVARTKKLSLTPNFHTRSLSTAAAHPLISEETILENCDNLSERKQSVQSEEDLFSFSDTNDLNKSSLSVPVQNSIISKKHPLLPQLQRMSSKSSESDESHDTTQYSWTYLSQPLSNILQSLFNFNEKTSLLRESAAMLLLKQGIFGRQDIGGLDKKIDDTLYSCLEIDFFCGLMERIEELVVASEQKIAADKVEKIKAELTDEIQDLDSSENKPLRIKTFSDAEDIKHEALESLLQLIPLPFKRIVGEQEARNGFMRIFGFLQNENDNKSVIFSILDELEKEFLK